MQRNKEIDFLRAVGTPLPRRGTPQSQAEATTPSTPTLSQNPSARTSLTPSSSRPAQGRNVRASEDDGRANASSRRPWLRYGLLGAGLAAVALLLVVLWYRTPPSQFAYRQLPDGGESAAAVSPLTQQIWEGSEISGLPALPEGQTCAREEYGSGSDRLHADAEHSLSLCQDKLRAAQQQAHSCEGLQQRVRAWEQEAKAATAQLKGRDGREKALDSKLTQAEADSDRLKGELGTVSAALSEAQGWAASSAAELQRAKEACAVEKEGARLESGRAAEVAARRVELLEGSLSECKGRLAGLGEGCGRCWQMLDEAQDEGRRAVVRVATWALAGCITVGIGAYFYGRFMRRKVVRLLMECEKLRCAALEAEGGFRQRTARTCHRQASAGPAQQFIAR